jgi:hypothetical protein
MGSAMSMIQYHGIGSRELQVDVDVLDYIEIRRQLLQQLNSQRERSFVVLRGWAWRHQQGTFDQLGVARLGHAKLGVLPDGQRVVKRVRLMTVRWHGCHGSSSRLPVVPHGIRQME